MMKTEEELNEDELEQMAEQEHKRLKRQFRIMENDRLTYTEEAKNQLRNQKNTIDRYEYEKSELVLDIRAALAPNNIKKDEIMINHIKYLLDKRTKNLNNIKKEKQDISELDEQILKLTKEVNELKLKVQTDRNLQEAAEKRNREIGILQNRLEVATKRFNTIVSDNVKLRIDIESLLKERGQFNVMWLKLNNQLNIGKQVINDLIEQSTITFNQRDEELNKINSLKEKGIRDLKNHTSEMCELQRTLDNEMKLQEFLGVKGQYRETKDLDKKKELEKQNKKEEMKNKIAVYNKVLNMVKQYIGENEISKLTSQFIKQEEENFALFCYVNELNDEVESLQTRVDSLRSSIDEARELNIDRGRKQAETLENISQKLKEETDLADAAENKLKQCNETLEQLLKGVESLFSTIQCDDSSILELLGNKDEVTMNNVMLYLGIIEKRIIDMFNKVHWIDKVQKRSELRLDETKKPKLKIQPITKVAPTQPCPLCVEKEEMQNVSDDIEKPLTLEEINNKLKLRLNTDHKTLLHNVSGCHLPASRKIIQKRFQE